MVELDIPITKNVLQEPRTENHVWVSASFSKTQSQPFGDHGVCGNYIAVYVKAGLH